MNGDRGERELSNLAEDEYGHYAQRTGSSGSATDRPRPDLLILVRDRFDTLGHTKAYAIEVKSTNDGTASFDAHEIPELIDIAERSGALPLVGVRPNFKTSRYDRWHFFDAHEIHETPGGNWSIRHQDMPGQSLEDILGRADE